MALDSLHEVSDEFSDFFKEIYKNFTFDRMIDYRLLGNTSLKSPISVKKISDPFVYMTKKDILIQVNEGLFDLLKEEETKQDEESDEIMPSIRRILIEQEISRIEYDSEKGKISVRRLDISTAAGIVNKFGAIAVMRANAVLKELKAQQEDESQS